MTEAEAYVAFNLTDNIGSVGVGRLSAAQGGSVADAWLTYGNHVSFDGQPVDSSRIAQEFAKARASGTTLLTPADADYPRSLLMNPGHPLCLYVRGNVKALSMPSIALVGTRRATAYGLDQAYRFGRDLAAAGWCIVSGLAVGIDAEAHRGALAAENGVTVGVIGSALNKFYPEKNVELAREIVKRGGAVVSEFPFGRPPDQKTFPQRNHVVAGLVYGVVAIEAPAKSGTLITVNIAAEMGKDVFAIPGRVDSQASAGCLNLIRDGAILARCPTDVSDAFDDLFKSSRNAAASRKPAAAAAGGGGAAGRTAAPPPVAPPRRPLSDDARAILHGLTPEGETIDAIVRRTGLPVAKVSAAAMSLLMTGLVRFLPGQRVALPREE